MTRGRKFGWTVCELYLDKKCLLLMKIKKNVMRLVKILKPILKQDFSS